MTIQMNPFQWYFHTFGIINLEFVILPFVPFKLFSFLIHSELSSNLQETLIDIEVSY